MKKGPLSGRQGPVGRNVFPTEDTGSSKLRSTFVPNLVSAGTAPPPTEEQSHEESPTTSATPHLPSQEDGSGDTTWDTSIPPLPQNPPPHLGGAGELPSTSRSDLIGGGLDTISEYPASSLPYTPRAIHPSGDLVLPFEDPVVPPGEGPPPSHHPSRSYSRALTTRRSCGEFSVILNRGSADVDNELAEKLRKLFQYPEANQQPHYDSWRRGEEYDDEDAMVQLVGKLYELSYLTNPNGPHGYSYKLHLGAIVDYIFDFVNIATPPGFNVKCKIIRRKVGVDGSFSPQYFMFIERNGEREHDIFLMTARRTGSAFSSYVISTNPAEQKRDSKYCIGILNGNFKRSKFDLYAPNCVYDHFEGDPKPAATHLLCVSFENEEDRLGSRCPRMIRTALPKLKEEYLRMNYCGKKAKVDDDDYIQLKNREPIWSQSSGTYVLNFNQRVTKSSIKNFILSSRDPDTRNHNILLFGKTSKHEFSLDFAYPLCPLQAFAIALASFDVKWGIE